MSVIKEIFEEFFTKRKELEMTKMEMLSYLEPYESVLLYGAGSSGIAFLYDLKKINIIPRFFVDSNKSKGGTYCEGIEVISPNQIREKVSGSFIVIVCINTDGKRYCKSFDEALRAGGHHAVYETLKNAGCRNIIDYTFFRKCFSIFKDEKYNAPSCSDVDLMAENENDLEAAYALMADDTSREVFEKIVRFRLLDDSLDVPTMRQDTQYFEIGLYHSRKDAVFVDCGAYNGISLKTFMNIQEGMFEHYYGIEPDKTNFLELKSYIDSFPEKARKQMTLYNTALWEDERCIKLYVLHGPGSFVADDIGHEVIKTEKLDHILGGGKVTFIKMNIEGSEKQALKGAENTVEIYKPELAIAGYHRTDDLWKIPLMINEMRKDYKIYLRSYMNHISFVFYAL